LTNKKAISVRRKILSKELQRIVATLIAHYAPTKIILFGSLSSGNIRETSDIDLFVIKETQKPYLARVDEVLHLTHPTVAIDFFVLNSKEVKKEISKGNPYLEEILEKGDILYERAS